MKRIIFLSIPLVFIVFAACKKKSTAFNIHADYFPIEEGRYVIYDVREVKIDKSLEKNDTTNYFLKTVIGAVETDNSGRPARRFERYIRFNQNDPWVLKDIWTTILDGRRVELVEENQRVIKLVLAPDKTKEWDMNAYNMLGELECYYENIHEPSSISGYNFDSTVKVIQQENVNLVDFRRKSETYAKGVGMISRYWKDYTINFDTTDIKIGSEIRMRMLSFGKE